MFVIYPYKLGSESAKALRDTLQNTTGQHIKLVKPDGRYRPRVGDLIINWGSGRVPDWVFPITGLNSPEAVRNAANKLNTFQLFTQSNISTVEWTTDKAIAEQWILDGHVVVARGKLAGHGGAGITLHGDTFPEALPTVSLYTKYKKKKAEYRVHVLKGEVIDIVQKKKRRGQTNINSYIRNIGNGWVFAREDITISEDLKALAINSINALGLDFGAVDIIYNQRDDKYYALEVNSAPGIEGTTLTKYAEALSRE